MLVTLRAPGQPIVQTIALEQSAHIGTMAVDERSRHLFVQTSVPPGVVPPGVTHLHIFDVSTGLLDSGTTRDIGHAYVSALGVAPRSGHVFLTAVAPTRLGTAGGYVEMRDRYGALLRAIPIDTNTMTIRLAIGGRRNQAVVGNAGFYYGSHPTAGSVSIFDAATGQLARRIEVSGMVGNIGVDGRANHVIVTSDMHSPAGPDSWTVALYDAATGRFLRRTTLPLQHYSPSIVVDEKTSRAFILGTGYRGEVYVFDTRTGRLVHTARVRALPTDVAVDEGAGRVFVAAPGPVVRRSAYASTSPRSGVGIDAQMPAGRGIVQQLDARTGVAIGAPITVGVAPVSLAIDARHGRVLVLDAGSRDTYSVINGKTLHLQAPLTAPADVSVLDAGSGRVLRTVTLDTRMAPEALALDSSVGRAFVALDGGVDGVSTSDPLAWLPSGVRRRLPFFQPMTTAHTVAARIVTIDTTGIAH